MVNTNDVNGRRYIVIELPGATSDSCREKNDGKNQCPFYDDLNCDCRLGFWRPDDVATRADLCIAADITPPGQFVPGVVNSQVVNGEYWKSENCFIISLPSIGFWIEGKDRDDAFRHFHDVISKKLGDNYTVNDSDGRNFVMILESASHLNVLRNEGCVRKI